MLAVRRVALVNVEEVRELRHGWPFDTDLRLGDVYGVLHGSFGVQGVEAVHFFSADLRRKRTLDQVEQRLRLLPESLFMSFEHRVVVQQ